MIHKNELRYGNFFYPNDENHTPYSVIELLLESVVCYKAEKVYESDETINYEDLQPIELTEDILIKAGFERITTKSIILDWVHYQKENIWIFLIDNGFELELDTIDDRFNLCVTYKYLHELQNLWKLLKGEELKIDL